jgi:hypothetical protein
LSSRYAAAPERVVTDLFAARNASFGGLVAGAVASGVLGSFDSADVDGGSATAETSPPARVTGLTAVASFAFVAEPTAPQELSFPLGAHLILTRRVDDHWFEGYVQGGDGTVGIFPVNRVQLVAPSAAAPPSAPSTAQPPASHPHHPNLPDLELD